MSSLFHAECEWRGVADVTMSSENIKVPWIAFSYDDFLKDTKLETNTVIGA
jgi:hypothetical protein